MSNSFYNAAGAPATGSALNSANVRSEFTAIAAGFDKMPTLSGNQYKVIYINSSGTAFDVIGGTGLLRLNAAGVPTIATAGTDYVTPTGSETLTNKIIDAKDNAILNASVDEALTSVSGSDTVVGSAHANVTAYLTGQQFTFIAAGANTGAVTLNVNSLGAKNIYKSGTLPLEAGDIVSGQAVTVVYDGTQFQFVSGAGGGGGAKAGGAIYENSVTISSNYTLTTSKNGFSVGPITVSGGAAVTVPSGQRWVVL